MKIKYLFICSILSLFLINVCYGVSGKNDLISPVKKLISPMAHQFFSRLKKDLLSEQDAYITRDTEILEISLNLSKKVNNKIIEKVISFEPASVDDDGDITFLLDEYNIKKEDIKGLSLVLKNHNWSNSEHKHEVVHISVINYLNPITRVALVNVNALTIINFSKSEINSIWAPPLTTLFINNSKRVMISLPR